MTGRCFVFAAAELYDLRESPRAGDFIVAADAGYYHCRAAGIEPDLLLGDFDSMPDPDTFPTPFADNLVIPVHFPHIERVPVEKDDTDTMLALKAGLSRQCRTFYIYGGTGGQRTDHLLANLQALLYLRRHGAQGFLYGENFVWTAIENEKFELRARVPDGLLSVFAAGGRAEGVTLSGVQYPLDNAVLRPDFPLGVSNHTRSETVSVSVRTGALYLGWELPPVHENDNM